MATIETVFIPDENRCASVAEFLDQDEEKIHLLRRALRPALRTKTLLCPECFQHLSLAGTLNQVLHFRHFKDSDDCPIKTTSSLSMEEICALKYNGQKEGLRHRTNKLLIAKWLGKDSDFSDVRVEKTYREENPTGISKSWRRPDVCAKYIPKNVDIAFELQVSTTFIDVIIDREEFYRKQGVFIVWIFLSFNEQRFTEKDITYANKANALVFDDEAQVRSDEQKRLYFKCYYREPYLNGISLCYEWKYQWSTLQELSFDEANKKLFLVDTAQIKADLLSEICKLKQEAKTLEKRARVQRQLTSNIISSEQKVSVDAYGKYINSHVNSEQSALRFISNLVDSSCPLSSWPFDIRVKALHQVADRFPVDSVLSSLVDAVSCLESSTEHLPDMPLRRLVVSVLETDALNRNRLSSQIAWDALSNRLDIQHKDRFNIFEFTYEKWLTDLKKLLDCPEDSQEKDILSSLERHPNFFSLSCLFLHSHGLSDKIKVNDKFCGLRSSLGNKKHLHQEDLVKIINWLFSFSSTA